MGWERGHRCLIFMQRLDRVCAEGVRSDRRCEAAPNAPTPNAGRDAGPGFAARRHFMSIGNWKHAPNVDAAAWACAEIWPRIRQALAPPPARAAAPPTSCSKQEVSRAALGSEVAARSSGAALLGSAAAAGSSGGARDSLPAGGSSGAGPDTEASHAEALPEFHLYGAYESHAARALHAPQSGIFVRGHAPTLKARRLSAVVPQHRPLSCIDAMQL